MKKINEESKRGYILLVMTVVAILSIVLSTVITNVRSHKIIEEVEKLKNSSEAKAVYIMRDGCGYCELNKNNIASIKEEYNFEYYNVNTTKLVKKDIDKLISILEITEDKFGTPHMAVFKDGKVVASLSGLKTYDITFNFLKENGLIATDSKLYLNYLDFKGYKKAISSSENQAIVLASSTCGHCANEHPELIKIAKETGAKINYAYLDYMFNSQEEYDEFLSSLKWFSENSNFGTPTTLIVKNKEVKSYLVGYRAQAEMTEFLKENGIVK